VSGKRLNERSQIEISPEEIPAIAPEILSGNAYAVASRPAENCLDDSVPQTLEGEIMEMRDGKIYVDGIKYEMKFLPIDSIIVKKEDINNLWALIESRRLRDKLCMIRNAVFDIMKGK
jgi:hypothetical protein